MASRNKDRDKLKGRNKRGHFAKGNTLAKGNGGSLGKIGPNYRHGLRNPAHRIQRDVRLHGERGMALDTALNSPDPFSQRLNAWRTSYIASCGGIQRFSLVALEALNLVVTDKLILNSVDQWLRTHQDPINEKTQVIRDVVMQRDRLANSFLARLKTVQELVRQTIPEDDDVEAALRGLE